MALSVNQQAAANSPVFSPQIFQATSTNTAQPNHSYTVVCTDVTTGISTKYQVSKDPTYNAMFFDASGFAKQFIKYFIPQYVGGFQKVAGSIRQITVNVGETYGSTPVYYPGSNYTYIVWSGIIDFLGFAGATYDTTKYIYNSGVNNVYMAGVTKDLAFKGRSNFLYILSDVTGTRPASVQIVGYNSAGASVVVNTITNTHASGLNTVDKNFVMVDVGDRNVGPGLPASVVKYDVFDGNGALIKTMTYGCENMFSPKVVHYLAKNGALQSAYFNLIETNKLTKQSQSYSVNPWNKQAFFYSYDINANPDRDFGITTQKVITLRTDWLTDEQIAKYADLWSSPLCFLDGDDDYPNSLIAIRPVTPEYRIVKKMNSKLFAWENEFVYSHQNYRQHV